MRFARRAVVNKLTALFDNNQTPTVVELLSNDDLAKSVTNEASQLVNFICPEDGKQPHLQDFLDWALTPTHFNAHERAFRFSQNAANVLSEPCAALQNRLRDIPIYTELLDKALHDFLNSGINQDGSERFLGHFTTIFMCVNRATQGGLLRRMRQHEHEFDRRVFQHVHRVGMMPLISYFFCDCPDDFAEPYRGDIGVGLILLLDQLKGEPRTGVCVFSLFHNMLQEFTESDLFIRADFVDKALDILDRATDPLLVRKGFHFLRIALDRLWGKSQTPEHEPVRAVVKRHAERFKPQDPKHWQARTAFQLYSKAHPEIVERFIDPFFEPTEYGFELETTFARAFAHAFDGTLSSAMQTILENGLALRLSEALSVPIEDTDKYVLPTNWNIIELVKKLINATQEPFPPDQPPSRPVLDIAIVDRVLGFLNQIDKQIHDALNPDHNSPF